MAKKIIVVGLSRLGAGIADSLSAKGEEVIAYDINEEAFKKLSDSFSGYQIIGDATDFELLEKNNIRSAKQVVVTTDNDNTNIFVAHVCYYLYGIKNVIIRLNDIEKKVLIEGTSIKALFPYDLSVERYKEISLKQEAN